MGSEDPACFAVSTRNNDRRTEVGHQGAWAEAPLMRRMGISVTGLAGALFGFLVFLLPRLWIGIGYLKGQGDETDESLREFWELAAVSLVYLPAIVAAVALPPGVRWVIMLLVAGVTQLLALQLASEPGIEVNMALISLPATILLMLGASTSFRSWREGRRGGT